MAQNQKNGRHSRVSRYRALDFVMLRAPLLPIESYLAHDDLSKVAAVKSSTLVPPDPQVRRALAIGSPSLLERLERTAPEAEKAALLKAKLRRFLVRMSTRPTPFGMFAGVAIGDWGEQTNISLDGTLHTRTRVDMGWLIQYVLALESQSLIRNQLRWVANSAAWIHHDRIVLSGPAPPSIGMSSAPGVSVAATSVVRRILGHARTPIIYPVLVKHLVGELPQATPTKVERVLEQLWEHGFLYTELMPPLTTDNPIRWVRDHLATIDGGKSLCVQLDGLLRAVASCDNVTIEEAPDTLRRATAHVAHIGPPPTGFPLQVDMAFGVRRANLSTAIAEEAARCVEILLSISPIPIGPPSLSAYRQAFLARYGQDREVRLPELLHPEWGLGPIGQRGWTANGIEPERAGRRADTLQALALNAVRNRELVIDLNEELIGRLQTHTLKADRFPSSVDLNLFVLASSAGDIDAGKFHVMVGPNVGAAAAGRNLGRFADLLGPDVRAGLEAAARCDEGRYPHHITAEIVYLPRNFRTANVAVRPAVRRYEIAHRVSAGVDDDRVIPLNELVVGVREGRFYVRWVTHNVEVVFASGHMLNPTQAPAECQLLSEISQDGTVQLSAFDWGPASGFPFLPRVQSGRSILRCAQWRIPHGEAPADKLGSFIDWFTRWRDQWWVPSRVYLSWADNRLLYNLDDPAQVDDLRGELARARDQGQCLLQEALPGPEHAWLPSADGGHRIAEVVVSLGLRGAPSKDATAGPDERHFPSLITHDDRFRAPGSDWLYLKVYGPRSGEDELLAGPVRNLCNEILETRVAENWFFIRYADPEPHLRLRFHGVPEQLIATLLPRLCKWASRLVTDGRCQKFSFDSYEREIERYGGPDSIAAAEEVFAADSCAVVELLACASHIDRTLLAVVTIDHLLTALGLSDVARLEWLKQTITSRREVGQEFRARRKELITALLNPGQLEAPIAGVLARRRLALAPTLSHLRKMELTDPPKLLSFKLYNSHVHMHCNRVSADQGIESRALGLLLRAREAIAHGSESLSDQHLSSASRGR